MRGSWLGIDVGGTNIKWEQLDDDDNLVGSGRVPTPGDGEIAVAEALASIIQSRSLVAPGVAGVGIAVPGHLTSERDSITLLPNVAGTWLGFPVKSWLTERTGIAPVLLNDARAFAVAELALGAAAGYDNVVFATIGTGIGGAVAANGSVVSTGPDRFGEVGHITFVVDGETCGCGSRGCVEAYAGGSAILTRAERRGVSIRRDGLALTALAKETSPAAREVLEEAYDAFAVGIASVCAFAGADLVVVGGSVADELPGYIERARVRLRERRHLLGDVVVRPALLGSRSGAIGAAITARASGAHVTSRVEQHA